MLLPVWKNNNNNGGRRGGGGAPPVFFVTPSPEQLKKTKDKLRTTVRKLRTTKKRNEKHMNILRDFPKEMFQQMWKICFFWPLEGHLGH